MKKKFLATTIFVIIVFCILPALAETKDGFESGKLPVKGMVTLVDLGAKKCIPCKMMAPILEELEEEYQGQAAIVFVDVWENPDAVEQFGIKVIPTQIFYDDQGREVLRHQGFFSKEHIIGVLEKLGVRPKAS